MQGRLSLRERLVILMVAAVLPIFALSIWFSARETRSRIDLAQEQLLFAASLLATSQGKAMDAAEQLLGAIAAIPDLRSWDRNRARCQSYFETLRLRYPMYSNIGLLATDGRPLCHARGTIGDASAADRAYFRDALAQRRFVMGEAIVGRLSGRSAIPFALPVLENGEPVAVVFAALDLALAAQELSRARLPDGARVMVADRRARILMEYPAEQGGRQLLRVTNHPEVQEAARNRSSGVGEGRDATGVERVYAYAPSRLVGDEGFIVRVGMDRSAAVAGGSARFDEMLLLLALATLAALAITWWVGGRVIVKPAKQILGTVRRLQQGRLDARVPMPAGHAPRGEFARIGAAFNLMANSLELRQLDLQNELGRSRSAYAALDVVINSMQEALIAVTTSGQFLMFNEAAARLFPLGGPAPMPTQWPALFGFFHADGVTPYELDDLPLVRSARGESGRTPLLLVRNAQVPEGRMLQCSWQPIRGEGGPGGGLVVFTDVTELQRLQAEQAAQFDQLRETQRKLLEAQRIGRVGNWELDLRSGRLWWSEEVFGLFGVVPGEFEPTLESFEQCVHPQDRPLLKPARDAALRDGDSINLEYRIVKPDGAIAWMNERGEARRGEQGEPAWFGGVVQDVTERKLAEQALRESERELQDYTSMLQRAAEAAQLIMAHPSLEATLQEVADQARHVIGASQASVTLTNSGASAPARSFSGDADGASPAGSPLTVPLVSRSGRHIGRLQVSGREGGGFTERDEYVLLELAQLAAIAVENARLFAEIRELNAGLEARIAERTAELEQQEKLYRTLAQQAPEVVWNTDAAGKLTFMSQAWYELVGGTADDWLGSTGMAAIHPDDRADVAANWLACMKSLQNFTGVRRIRAKDGSYHTMSYKAAPVLDDNGQVAFWVGIDADITEFKAIERALRSSNQELESFSYSVSHDLRAPLGAIDGFSKALLARLEGHGDERARHYLARIQAGVEKMEELIDALLSLARVARAPLHYGAVDLTAIARETLEGLQMQHPERRVQAQVQEGLVAQGDARLLRVLLENLLGNAWKFTSVRREAHIEVGRAPDSDAFFVRDDGVGFDMAYAGKLFGPFQRLHTQAEFPGTGIGLATVRRIVARHQGRAWAESRLGEGTTFFFRLSETAPPSWLAGPDPL